MNNHGNSKLESHSNTDKPFKLDFITLSFDPPTEEKYQREYYTSSLIFLRLSFIAGVLFYLLFAILDYTVAGEFCTNLIKIRLFFVLPIILLVLILSYFKGFERYWQNAIILSLVASGLGIILMLIDAPEIVRSNYYVGLILVLIYGYMLIKLRFILASITGMFLVIAYFVVDRYALDISDKITFMNGFFLVSANVTLMLGSYFMEYYTRKAWYTGEQLKHEQQLVREINENLESRISERTRTIEKMNQELNNKIAQLHESQKVLKENEEQLRFAFDASNTAIWGILIPSEKFMFDDVAVKILNYPESISSQVNSLRFIHPDDQEKLKKLLSGIKDGTISNIDEEFRLRAYQGSWKWLHALGKISEQGYEGHALSVMGTIIDINERKEDELELSQYRENLEKSVQKRTETLEASQKALVCLMEDMNLAKEELTTVNSKLKSVNEELESFSYSVSHDLRAPLRAIDGFSHALMEDLYDKIDDDSREYLSLISANAVKMNQLISDLLEFSRLGRRKINTQNVNLNSIFNNVYRELMLSNQDRKIEFSLGQLPEVLADPALIKQVIVNLLSNAVKFTRTRKIASIEVGFVVKENEYIFFVKDNGVGFDMNYSQKLFGVFQRLHSDEEFEGYGVGLSLVKRIITRHNGRIWAESEKDKGATFFFSLPVKKKIDIS